MKVSSLACKCVFYRPEHNSKGKPHEIEFWRCWYAEMKYTRYEMRYEILDRAQKVDEKMGSFV